jgi:hypothetical protein
MTRRSNAFTQIADLLLRTSMRRQFGFITLMRIGWFSVLFLYPNSYLRLSASELASKREITSPTDPPSQPQFYVHGNLYYPNVVKLLRSIITVYLKERRYTTIRNWQGKLSAWAFGYLYGELLLRDDVLDTCED